MPTRNSKGLYCSRACQANGIRKYSSPQQAKRAERERWKERTGWQPRPKAPPKPALIHQPRPCKGCAAPFVPHHGSAGFCSAACKRSASNRSRKVYGNKARKRARYHGVAYEPVNRLKLFERDRWRCQVCGVKTPQRLMGTYEPNAPEMDHRIPMAMGGPHTWANVQCACRRCNLAKGGTIIAGQLPLFADVR
jgi:5-methylcytosine-specific restriction endonuclease McrA